VGDLMETMGAYSGHVLASELIHAVSSK
jgi:hypothetical protein